MLKDYNFFLYFRNAGNSHLLRGLPLDVGLPAAVDDLADHDARQRLRHVLPLPTQRVRRERAMVGFRKMALTVTLHFEVGALVPPDAVWRRG